jgi:hypothetical protein
MSSSGASSEAHRRGLVRNRAPVWRLGRLRDPILDRLPTRRTSHQIAALYEAIEDHADVNSRTLRPRSPAAFSSFKNFRSPRVRTINFPPNPFPLGHTRFFTRSGKRRCRFWRARQAPRVGGNASHPAPFCHLATSRRVQLSFRATAGLVF